MLALALQAIVLAVISFSIGLLLGGWLIGSRRRPGEKHLRHELAGVKANFQNAREDAHRLRGQLKQVEAHSAKLSQMLTVTSGHSDFQRVRQKLELARREIQSLKGELSEQEDKVFDLNDAIHALRKHVKLRRQNLPGKTNNIVKLPVTGSVEDDLALIDGMTDEAAHQLRNLGFVSYRQIAECSSQQLVSIQRMIGGKKPLPLKRWVLSARQLCWKKYGKSSRVASRTAKGF